MSDVLLHIVPGVEWEAAQRTGELRPASLATEGFVHLSKPEQVLFPANLFYRGQTGLFLLVVDPQKLTAPVRFDDVPGHGTFPHLYGPLNSSAVIHVLPFEPKADGTFALPPQLTDITGTTRAAE